MRHLADTPCGEAASATTRGRAAQRQRGQQKTALGRLDPAKSVDQTDQPKESTATDVDALVRACADGAAMLVLRGASRTGKVFAEELLAAAQHAGVREDQLSNVGSSLWLLNETAYCDLRGIMPALASTRLSGRLVLAAASISEMIGLLSEGGERDALRERVFGQQQQQQQQQQQHWTLRIETNFPSANPRVLPFHALDAIPEICFALSNALGGTFVDSSDDDIECVNELALLQMKDAVVLLHTESSPTAQAASRNVAGIGPSRIPQWMQRWERRDFAFSSSLDPLVAMAAISIATFAHIERNQQRLGGADVGETRRSLRIFDPCCGSGTILAAAAALGHTNLVGADVRPEFVECATSNLATQLDGDGHAHLFVHDASTADSRSPDANYGGH